jgi:hypothetical protein
MHKLDEMLWKCGKLYFSQIARFSLLTSLEGVAPPLAAG